MTIDLLENYSRAYGNRAGFGKRPALLLVDFLQAYFVKASSLYADVEAALRSALRIREVAHEREILVVLSKVVYHPSGKDGGRFLEKALPLKLLVEGSPLGAWPEGLVPQSDELVISKQYPSVFFGTSLASTLIAAGVDNVILTGLTTSGCVRASCVDAVSHGFITTAVEQACADRHAAPYQANLFDMNAKYANVVSEAEIMDFLRALPT